MPQWVAIGTVYLLPALFIALPYVYARRHKSQRATQVYQQAAESGLLEPASLHPVIDNQRCLGCATCVAACPEKEVLGIIGNRAQLITPASCIGHGACQEACPTDAISLVFGTASRGVDIPLLAHDFQTSVNGIYIAGELGGMGLIRNAIEQGRQAIEAIAANNRRGQSGQLDLVIVGAGPSGISAAMSASELGLNYLVLEQDSIGGTIAHYPRGKVVMTAPARLPLVGEFRFGETSKEELMVFWSDVVERAQLNILTQQQVAAIEALNGAFQVQAGESYLAANVLLCIGRRGTPRKLDVPGEDLCKVVYRLVDPEQFRGQKILVVGWRRRQRT